MSLEEIKGNYDAIFSLGDLCLASMQLKKSNLRSFSGVLDWMASPALKDVNRLLDNRFAGYMDRQNLRIIGYATDKYICVADEHYNMVSNHDFEATKNTIYSLNGYQEVREKFDRRINRFLDKAANSKRILFVRTEGSFEDTLELHSVLSGLVKNEFRILIVNHTNVTQMVVKDWPIEGVTVVDLPDKEKWSENDHYWESILEGVQIRE
ncbi:DUF1796 family putative cysteine peptidase [Metabacillus idriensis]|uniref:DUF1796 family putative cysteine peptidase n=1 Tax=Metabacillus idriensis TaxID=324768 RepID=UPI0017488568|nr:DUF1796 family putative cysteine peptidase [Metabacillus idriensis]